MDRLYLKFPGKEDKENILEFKDEFLASGQKVAGFAGLDKMNFDEWLDKIEREKFKETCEEGRVPATQFLAIRKEDEKLVGMVQVRHELNDYLLKFGGHIGDCVRPSEQGKGYATEQIGLALEFCRELGLERVLITCKKENVASARTIIKNGGVLENEIPNEFENNIMMQRYWIDIK